MTKTSQATSPLSVSLRFEFPILFHSTELRPASVSASTVSHVDFACMIDRPRTTLRYITDRRCVKLCNVVKLHVPGPVVDIAP